MFAPGTAYFRTEKKKRKQHNKGKRGYHLARHEHPQEVSESVECGRGLENMTKRGIGLEE